MTSFGYTVMTEQAGPRQLVLDAIGAEQAGFDYLAASDHYNPWLAEQGHSPNVWPVLGAIAQATERIGLMTYVSCPIIRQHPTVVAQQAATVQLLSGGRFTLGLGAGEHLNEHVTGEPWPSVDVRHDMLTDAVEIIGPLLAGDTVTYRGRHLHAEGAKLWDAPHPPPPIGIAASGPASCEIAGAYADLLIAVEPDPTLIELFEAAGGEGKPKVGQVPLCYDEDESAARKRALEQFRWFAGGWEVNAGFPGPAHFAAASKSVTEQDVARQIPCGPDVDRHVEAVAKFIDAGFTHVAVVQIGGDHQDPFLAWSAEELLPALRRLP